MKSDSISAEARSDLDSIGNYIAERSGVETATEFLWKFYASFTSIASSPSVGDAIPDFQPFGIRKFFLFMGKFLFYYLPGRGKVSIVCVANGKCLQMRASQIKRTVKPIHRKGR